MDDKEKLNVLLALVIFVMFAQTCQFLHLEKYHDTGIAGIWNNGFEIRDRCGP